MRYLLIFLLIPVCSWGQSQFWNTSCANASFLSPNEVGDTMSVEEQPNCIDDVFVVYYYYHSAVAASSGNIIDFSTSTNSSYKVYGGFTDKVSGCNLIPANLITSGTSNTSHDISHAITADQFYILEITVYSCNVDLNLCIVNSRKNDFSNEWESEGCVGCISGFRPGAGKYIVSAWVKDAFAPATTTNYTRPYISVLSSTMTTVNLFPSGEIIDGWQRIEGEVTTLVDGDFEIQLQCGTGGDCYFDDVRVHPFDASMMSYVYDPKTLRLMAELDERNYAKFYEYDEDGKLIRIKKETEKGIMTIQESRENNSKQ
jgi:hypothetical protein